MTNATTSDRRWNVGLLLLLAVAIALLIADQVTRGGGLLAYLLILLCPLMYFLHASAVPTERPPTERRGAPFAGIDAHG